MERSETFFNGRRYRLNRGYYACHDKWKAPPRMLHRDVWEFYYGKIPVGMCVHHIDGDKTNNDIDNLMLMRRGAHSVRHNTDGVWQRSARNLKEVLPKARELSHVAARKPENRKKRSENWSKNKAIQDWIGSSGAKKALDKAQKAAPEWHKSDEGRAWHRDNAKKSWAKREPEEAVCTVCGKKYYTYFKNRSKFCHDNCKATALRRRKAARLQPDGR